MLFSALDLNMGNRSASWFQYGLYGIQMDGDAATAKFHIAWVVFSSATTPLHDGGSYSPVGIDGPCPADGEKIQFVVAKGGAPHDFVNGMHIFVAGSSSSIQSSGGGPVSIAEGHASAPMGVSADFENLGFGIGNFTARLVASSNRDLIVYAGELHEESSGNFSVGYHGATNSSPMATTTDIAFRLGANIGNCPGRWAASLTGVRGEGAPNVGMADAVGIPLEPWWVDALHVRPTCAP
jgi:hypothetical protein